MSAKSHKIDEFATQALERRKLGDRRPLAEVVRDLLADISSQQAKMFLERQVCARYLYRARQVSKAEEEKQLTLPYSGLAIGRYRTPILVRVRRDGREDFMSPDVVLGKEINRHDAWEKHQKRRDLQRVTKRAEQNAAHSVELSSLGFDPDTQTVHEMHSAADPRICVHCGEPAIAGDPWQRDHDTPIAVSEGMTPSRMGWSHQSCNQAKGATEMPQQYPHHA